MHNPEVSVGIIGCGTISDIYLANAPAFGLRVAACADIDLSRARQRAEEHGVPVACSPEDLVARPEIELVINLTVPAAHADVSLRCIEAGKHVYSEKPLAVTRQDGVRIIEAARRRGVLVGCAPDTFLGGGLQTCRELIDRGAIGRPVAATAFMMGHGPEGWHPSPEFFYKHGAGPMLDMGPYYLTALVSLIGPVRSVSGRAAVSFPERTITSQPLKGTRIAVEVPTHVVGVLDFESGAVGTIITSWDVWGSRLPRIEIYGSEATLSVPDPNTFGGPVQIKRAGSKEWEDVPIRRPHTANSRGLGAGDLAAAAREGRSPRASGNLALHVLDIMQTIHEAALAEHALPVASQCARPEPL